MTPLLRLFLLIHLCVALDFASAAESKRNVLFLVSDDLNCDLGCYGDKRVKSPHLDKLAARGVRFDRAYCQFPLCSPSRSSFMTGRRPNATGVLTNPGRDGGLSPHFREKIPDTLTLPQLFKKQGWFAARVGKLYHYGVPNDIGTGSLDDYRSWDLTLNPRGMDRELHDRIFSMQPGQFGGTVSWLAVEGGDAEHTDGIGAVEAVKLLERFKGRHEPFFLAVGFYRPHTPYVAPKKYFDLYPLDQIELPALSGDDKDRAPAPAYASAKKEQDSMTDQQRREAIRAYHASISFMDAQVGVVLETLERLGLSENTVVAFTSDHGYHLADHGLWQKQSLFERSARVPLIIAAPGVQAAGRSEEGVVEMLDIYPTLAALCNLPVPDYLDGTSLVPMLDAPRKSVKEMAFTQVRRGQNLDGYSVRTARWRYTEWGIHGEKGTQLFDEQNDPAETKNLAADPQHAATIAELKQQLMRVRDQK